MRVKADTVQKAILGAALLGALVWNLAHAAEVRSVELARGATGTRADITLDAPADYRLIRLSNPDRLVVDLPASRVRRGAPLPGPAGVVRGVRYGQPEPGIARIVFDLAQPVAALQPRVEPSAQGSRLVIEWPGDADPPAAVGGASTAVVATVTGSIPPSIAPMPEPVASLPPPSAAAPPRDAPITPSPASVAAPDPIGRLIAGNAAATSATQAASTPPAAGPAAAGAAAVGNAGNVSSTKPARDATRPLRPLVIAIDAGHGGQDPGAHGPSGRREKDVTLAIARELARQVNATPGYRAYLTRDADFFIPLNERARLAKKAGADMFVSIHADAAENPAARGSSVFVLSLKGASSQRARWLADKENAADLIGGVRVEPGNTLASVLLDLTQSGNLKASEDVAGQVLRGLAQLGPNHKSTVERANFAVLRTSDIPAMLVETAFISNPEEEQRLADPVQQAAIARAVFSGINGYFVRTPPPGTMLAARAAQQDVASAGGRTSGGR